MQALLQKIGHGQSAFCHPPARLEPCVVETNNRPWQQLFHDRGRAIEVHLVAVGIADTSAKKLLVAGLAELAVLAVIKVVSIKENAIHVAMVGREKIFALGVNSFERNPAFAEHLRRHLRVGGIHIHRDEMKAVYPAKIHQASG